MENIIGRKFEQNILKSCYDSPRSELVVMYGRRRVGKTFLIRQFFGDRFDFFLTGIYDGTKREQLATFNRRLCLHSGEEYPTPEDWAEAFEQLKQYLTSLGERKILVFIDEIPWLDTQKSRFMKNFELFWNEWASMRGNIKLIVCGSATTWMLKNLIHAKGGLYNRSTRKIKLSPFSLCECEHLLAQNGFAWNRYQIAEAYMIFGGIPYYLQILQKEYSLIQNVDILFFKENAELKGEYDILFKSLFKNSTLYRDIVETLAENTKGMTRKQLVDSLKVTDGGSFSDMLDNLENCDFVRAYSAMGKKERDVLYQLTDPFILFHLKFVKGYKGQDENRWSNMIDSPSRRAWSGYSFEQMCLHHIRQIKSKLGISGVSSDIYSWSAKAREGVHGAQIDLLIDRRDQVINLCEMKFSQSPYELTESYLNHMLERMEIFRTDTKTTKALYLTMVTTYGLKPNAYSGMIQSEVVLDDLFQI